MKTDLRPFLPTDVPGAAALAPGEARCPAPSVQQIIRSDAKPPPPQLTHEHYVYLGSQQIDYERYYAPERFAAEVEQVWMNTWQWACREEHIPEPGDYYVYEVAHLSFIVVRTETRKIKAYYNACLHRGTKLRAGEGCGSATELRCPYHGWTWGLAGELKRVPCAWDFPHVKPDDYKLPEIHVATWGGFVFVNPAATPPPLEDYLGVIPEHFRHWGMDQRYVEVHTAKELPCNWKTAMEAFMESYHVLETHPQLLTGVGDANVQYDVYGEHVSRFYAALGINSPHLAEPLTEQALVNQMLIGDRSVLAEQPDELRVQQGETARTVMSRYLRKIMGEKYKVDLSRFSDSEMIDTLEYTVFPNMFLFPGLSLPMVYRFRPLGLDPEKTLFEILFMRPVPDDGSPPPAPAEPFRVGMTESYTIVPGFDAAMGAVYDQDTNNLRAQQQGFRASKKRGQTLANYQEVRIRHFQNTIDQYLKRRTAPGDSHGH